MAFTPSGPISLAIQAACVMLADSTNFRTLVGAADRAAALVYIHWKSWPEPANKDKYTAAEIARYRPYALVAPEESSVSQRELIGSDHGEILIMLGRADPGNDRVVDEQTWDNVVGNIRDDLLAMPPQAGNGEYIQCREINIDEDPFWDENDRRFGEGQEQRAMISLVY